MKWVKRILIALLGLLVLLIAAIFGVLMWFQIPQNAAGMAAKSICSASFVAGRGTDADALMAADVTPASPALKLISTTIDASEKTVTSQFLGIWSRQASLLPNRGCVLNEAPSSDAKAYTPVAMKPGQWPNGDEALPEAQWPAGTDKAKLNSVLTQAFVGSGDPQASNARGVAVVQDGKLLAAKEGTDIQPGTALHGWSMTKTVAGMLFYTKAKEAGIDINAPVVSIYPTTGAPQWVNDWRTDDRAKITIADLLYMRPGLDMTESYDPTGQVVKMLYGESNMAQWAAEHQLDATPGTQWEYLSATSNILAAVSQQLFGNDLNAYWTYPKTALFDQIGVDSATLETDTTPGTWVGSSYLWADIRDWARMGELMLNDGNWQGKQVFPAGWVELATKSAVPTGEGHGYGAQTWLLGDPVGGECKAYPGVPKDTMAMEGHWGQVVAMIPSHKAVIARLGWTFNKDQFDECQFISDVVSALPKS